MTFNRKAIVKWMLTILWIAMGAGTVVLLAAAVRKQDTKRCAAVVISIKGVNNNFFVDEKDILNSITAIAGGNPVGQKLGTFDLKTMERELLENIWVKKAQLFFDNNEVLKVNVIEREPVARVFTTTGTTFYVDTAVAMLPLSEKFSARLPVFTGFPSDKAVLTRADSFLLRDILVISKAIQKDPFCMAMIDQVDITSQRTFEMIPKMGNTVIVFGDVKDAEAKLDKLKLFYKQVIAKAGWNYYSSVSLQYQNQIVAKRKGADDKSADSLRTLQLIQLIAADAERRSNDSLQKFEQDNERNSTDINLIQQSFERDGDTDPSNANEKPEPQGFPVAEKPIHFNPLPPAKQMPGANGNGKPLKPASKNVAPKPVNKPAKPPVKLQVQPKPVVHPAVQPKPPVAKPPQKKTTGTKTNNDY